MENKTVIFDLDGTLLNTLADIAKSANFVLSANGYPPHEINKYKAFIGEGTDKIITVMHSERGEKTYFTWSTKGDYSGFFNLKEIKLQPEDVEKLAKKMAEK